MLKLAGGMCQQVRSFAALAEDLASFPCTMVRKLLFLGDLVPSSCLLEH